MGLKKTLSLVLLLLCPSLLAEPAKRIAILPANSQFSGLENRVADGLTAQLAGTNGIAIIDRASIDKILKEQNFQNSDRSSLDTAARIGKLVGAGQIVLVQVVNASYTGHQETSGNTTKKIGTVVLQSHARVIDVETAVILGQPQSSFEDSAEISETTVKKGSNGISLGPYRKPPTATKSETTGSDPQVVQTNEITKAVDAVTKDLTAQLTKVIGAAPGAKSPVPLVAGIANGSVYINEGATSGIKAGDRFQIVRKVDVGLKDPTTGQPITENHNVCVLVVTNVNENSSSGNCQGSIPQSGDMAEPVHP